MKYKCYTPLAPKLAAQIIEAPSSFEARKQYAAQHTAMELSDVCAQLAEAKTLPDEGTKSRLLPDGAVLTTPKEPDLTGALLRRHLGLQSMKEPFYSKAAGCWIDLAQE